MVSSDIDRKALEKEVDKAIEKKDTSLVVLDSKTKEECKYMQKYTELLFSNKVSSISLKSYLIGIDSVFIAMFAIVFLIYC